VNQFNWGTKSVIMKAFVGVLAALLLMLRVQGMQGKKYATSINFKFIISGIF